MIDASQAGGMGANMDSGSTRNWADLREQVREMIRAEVDRLHPTDDARRALELIIESSLRYSETDGRLSITVIGKDGQPRTTEKQGQSSPFTIRDLLDELRVSHPVLFKSPKGDPDEPEAVPAPLLATNAAVPDQPDVAPERDWLSIGSNGPSLQAEQTRTFSDRTLFHLRRGKVHFHGWSRKAFAAMRKSGASPELTFVPYGIARAKDRARDLIADFKSRPAQQKRRFAVGAVMVAALLGTGALVALLVDNPPPVQASVEEPLVTGAVTPAPVESVPAATASRPRLLRGVPDVIDTATLSLEGEVVRLFGVEWAPGGGKPEDLNRYLNGREVTCEPAGLNDTYRCQVGDQDLSRVVLFNGGGKPTGDVTPELAAAADQARKGKVGVWKQQ